MIWPRGIRFASSVICAKPNETSSTPNSAWRNCQKVLRQTLPKSHRPRPEWQPVPPRSITGRRWAVPGVKVCPMCRASCILGDLRTRAARRPRRLRSSCEPRSRRLKHCLRPTACRCKRAPWTRSASSSLALMYWQEQLRRTRCPGQKAQIALVLRAVEEAFKRHSCTRQLKPEVLAGWQAWATEHARAFQRASSAVEGRNGYLSQMQHNHRGLPARRYQVWTVLHNFDCRATDGTTPASRFFRRPFPDLFESVLSQIDALPMPRQRRQAIAVSD